MKRLGNTWEKICSRENVEKAFDLAVKGKKARLIFKKYREDIIQRVWERLNDGSYDFGDYRKITVFEPKRRIIHYPRNFDTFVLHKCLLNVVGPYFISKLPDDSYASIKGRGIKPPVYKLKKFIKTHKDWYFFQGDVNKFFESIDHDVLKATLRTFLKCKKTLEFCDKLIDSFGTGVPIGNHPSPYLGNLMLARIGHRIKEVWRAKLMLIYMDDILVCFKTKQEAMEFKDWLENELSLLNLKLKPNWRVAPIKSGIDFLGYKFYDTHTRLRKRIKNKMKRKARKVMDLPDEEFKRLMSSYYGWCTHADCKHLLKSTFKHKYSLFNGKKKSRRLPT